MRGCRYLSRSLARSRCSSVSISNGPSLRAFRFPGAFQRSGRGVLCKGGGGRCSDFHFCLRLLPLLLGRLDGGPVAFSHPPSAAKKPPLWYQQSGGFPLTGIAVVFVWYPNDGSLPASRPLCQPAAPLAEDALQQERCRRSRCRRPPRPPGKPAPANSRCSRHDSRQG